jgi:fucose permease
VRRGAAAGLSSPRYKDASMRAPTTLLLLLSYLAFVSLGLPDTVLGVAWPSLRERFGLSQAALGAVLGANVSGYFLSGLVAGRLVVRLGVGRLLAASSGLVALGLVGYATAPRWSLFFPVGAVIGLGSGAIDAALNSHAARHFPARHLNWLHACWGLGATVGPALMTAAIAHGPGYQAGYATLCAVLGAMALAFLATRRSWGADGADPVAAEAAGPAHDPGAWAALRRGRVWLQIAVFFLYTGLESSAGQWCFTVMREGRGLGVEEAGSWTAGYWASLTAGRIVLGFVIDWSGPDRLLRVATAGAVAGAALFALGAGLAGRLGLLLLGASLAPVYPTLMSRTPARLGHAATPHTVGFQVSAATLGAAVLPGAVGLLAARWGVGAIGAAGGAMALLLLALHEALLRATRPAQRPAPDVPGARAR